jgi:hypothetical protein
VRSARGVAGSRSAAGLAGVVALVLLVPGLTLAGCGSSPASTGAEGSPATLASPVTGLLVKIDSQGLTKVRGFTLRTDSGAEIPFTVGILENGAEFPPGHLAEHMATSSPVRVFFRDESGPPVVYRIEDAE